MTAQAYTPRPYQRLITDHILEHPRCAIWAGMGLGKTVSTLTALGALLLVEEGPVLVIAPKRVAISTWPDEVKKWKHLEDLRVSVVTGTAAERRAALYRKADIYCINYDNLPWLVELNGERWPFTIVVADEATRLKGFRLKQGTLRARKLGSVAHTKIQRFIELTGTPSPNGLKDLWGQAWFLDAGVRLGRTFSAFEQRWFRPTFNGYDIEPLPFSREKIQDKLADLVISLRTEDWFDIDKPVMNTVFIDLPSKARSAYRQLEREMFAQLQENAVEAFSAAALTVKCLQLANGAVYYDEQRNYEVVHDEKIEALRSIVEEAAGAPVLVAYQFKSDLARLARAFPQGRALDSDPGTVRAWNAGGIPVLFAHPASAGHGLNLQDGGNILAVFGHWWNLEEYQQIIERIGPVRQTQAGHPRPVYIHHIVARDTVDELVMARRESKREVQDLLLEAMRKRG